MKQQLSSYLNNSRGFNALLVCLVLASLIVFTLETEFTGSKALRYTGVLIAGLFAVEYLLRVWVADLSERGRLGYISSFEGLVDLIAFLPALFIAGADASIVLRALRIFRLAQLLKIHAVSRGIRRVRKALASCRYELAVSVTLSLGLIFCGAVLIYFIEGKHQPEVFGSIPRALWWSMATLTTVGYGDVYPITAFGKVVASIIAFIGIGAVALPAGIIASAFMSVESNNAKDVQNE